MKNKPQGVLKFLLNFVVGSLTCNYAKTLPEIMSKFYLGNKVLENNVHFPNELT